ncbi:MAG: DUF4242 domain-containing protein [Azonexus sp.]
MGGGRGRSSVRLPRWPYPGSPVPWSLRRRPDNRPSNRRSISSQAPPVGLRAGFAHFANSFQFRSRFFPVRLACSRFISPHPHHLSRAPSVGALNPEQLKGAAGTSNGALAQLGGKVQWVHSYVVADKTFCIYLADDEGSVQEHARLSGFPASKVTEVRGVISPMTAFA